MALAILVILGGISMPAMLGMIQCYRANAGHHQLVADLRFVQYQAISRGMQTWLVIFEMTPATLPRPPREVLVLEDDPILAPLLPFAHQQAGYRACLEGPAGKNAPLTLSHSAAVPFLL